MGGVSLGNSKLKAWSPLQWHWSFEKYLADQNINHALGIPNWAPKSVPMFWGCQDAARCVVKVELGCVLIEKV